MIRRFRFWLVFGLLVILAASDVAVNGWYMGVFPQNERNVNEESVAHAARIERVVAGREFVADLSAAGIHRLLIDNPGGSVVVKAALDDEIRLRAWLAIYTNDEVVRNRVLEEAQLVTAATDGTLRPEFVPDPGALLDAHSPWDILWEITIPAHLDVAIVNHAGPVSVEGMTGDLEIVSKSGSVDLAELKGSVDVSLDGSNLVAASLDGPLAVQAKESRVNIHDMHGAIHVESHETYVSATQISGDAYFDAVSGRIFIHQFSGDLTLRSVGGQVEVRSSQGAGKIDLDITGGIAAFEIDDYKTAESIRLRARSAHVAWMVPRHQLDHTLDLRVARGSKVVTEWPLQTEGSDSGSRYYAQFGEGAYPLRVDVENGARVDLGIRIRPGGAPLREQILMP